MIMIASLSSVASSADPVPQFALIAKAGGFSDVYVGYAGKTAKFSDGSGVLADYDSTSRPWYQQVVHDDAPVVTEPYTGTGKLVVTFAVPVKENGTLKAIMTGDVALDRVVANIREIHPASNSSGLLLNSDGRILAASNPALTLKSFGEALSGIDFGTLTRGETASGRLDGADKIPSAAPVPGTLWLLVVALDEVDATSSMTALLKTSVLCLIVLVVLGGIVVHLLIAAILRRLISIRNTMLAIGNGINDLSQRLQDTGRDEVTQIAQAFNLFSDKLAKVMLQLRDATTSVQTAEQEIASGNHGLSTRTEQAASSLRETASAVEQISASVAQSTKSASTASTQTNEAIQKASRGDEVVSSAINTMQDIEAASAKIGDIISVIDGIAFQTNILALNAAVEAARAGERGRGARLSPVKYATLPAEAHRPRKKLKRLLIPPQKVWRRGHALYDWLVKVWKRSSTILVMSLRLCGR